MQTLVLLTVMAVLAAAPFLAGPYPTDDAAGSDVEDSFAWPLEADEPTDQDDEEV